MSDLLRAAYPTAALPLARYLPHGEPRHTGLRAAFTDLGRLADHLEADDVDGYLAVTTAHGDVAAVALLFEGRLVSANAATDAVPGTLWADAALHELARQYGLGATLDAFTLERPLVHALAGVSDRAWRVTPGDGFTGARLDEHGMVGLYAGGHVIARVDAAHRESGAFPAPLRPPSLSLPRVVGAWAEARYALTLRGRDAVNPITEMHVRARVSYGRAALDLLTALGRGLTPLDAAARLGRDVNDIEGTVDAFVREGLLRREG